MKEYIVQKIKLGEESICLRCFHYKTCRAVDNQPCFECNQYVPAAEANTDHVEYIRKDDIVTFVKMLKGIIEVLGYSKKTDKAVKQALDDVIEYCEKLPALSGVAPIKEET